jgi:hypothetical protein
MKKNKILTRKKILSKRPKYTLKYDLELRYDCPERGPREWERLEDHEAFKEGFLLAVNNVSLKINTIRKNWNHKNERNL